VWAWTSSFVRKATLKDFDVLVAAERASGTSGRSRELAVVLSAFRERRHLPSDLGIPGRHLVANPSESAQKMRGTSILVERLYSG
jgi:hypothetical protein